MSGRPPVAFAAGPDVTVPAPNDDAGPLPGVDATPPDMTAPLPGRGSPAAPGVDAPAPNAADSAAAPLDAAALAGLLQQVIGQARALGIPVSAHIQPQVRLNSRAKKRFGCCIGGPGQGYVIELSAALPAAGRAVCLQTLAHEVLHTCPGCQNHGPAWKAYAARMGAAYGYAIHRTDKPEALGVQLPAAAPPRRRWCVTCTACGRQFYRQKSCPVVRTPARYRCAACGGPLRVTPCPAPGTPIPD